MEFVNYIKLRGIVGVIKKTDIGDNVSVNMSVVTDYGYRGKDGTPVIETMWHNVRYFENKTKIPENLGKGSVVEIEGRLRFNKYIDENGETKTFNDVLASSITYLGETFAFEGKMAMAPQKASNKNKIFLLVSAGIATEYGSIDTDNVNLTVTSFPSAEDARKQMNAEFEQEVNEAIACGHEDDLSSEIRSDNATVSYGNDENGDTIIWEIQEKDI